MKQTKQKKLQRLIESHVTNPAVQKHMIELSAQAQQEQYQQGWKEAQKELDADARALQEQYELGSRYGLLELLLHFDDYSHPIEMTAEYVRGEIKKKLEALQKEAVER